MGVEFCVLMNDRNDCWLLCRAKAEPRQGGAVGATHYIYVSDVPGAFGDKSFSSDVASNHDLGYPMPRGSLKSLRKASYDIKSISNDSEWKFTCLCVKLASRLRWMNGTDKTDKCLMSSSCRVVYMDLLICFCLCFFWSGVFM